MTHLNSPGFRLPRSKGGFRVSDSRLDWTTSPLAQIVSLSMRSRVSDTEQGGPSKHGSCPARAMPLSPRQADGEALPLPGLEGVRSEEGGQVPTPRANPKARSHRDAAAPALGAGELLTRDPRPNAPLAGRTAGTYLPNKHTSTHPTNKQAEDRSQNQKGSHRPAPAPRDGVCVLPHLYEHPTSPARTRPPGWPWLAALRQDVTVCLPQRTSGHLAFAA